MTTPAWSHDVFLKPASYHVETGSQAEIIVCDGSFNESVYAITTGSVSDLQVLTPDGLRSVDTSSWDSVKQDSPLWKLAKKRRGTLGGANLKLTSSFNYTPEKSGSHVLGLTLYEFRVAIELDHFVKYLKEEAGQDWDMAAYGFTEPKDIVRERFTKTAKSIVQAGGEESPYINEPMGLLVEIVPKDSMSSSKVGDILSFQLFEEGAPLPNQPVIIGRKGDPDLHLVVTSDSDGMVSLPITHADVWFLKFIHILPAPEDDPIDFFSRWASLTFEIQ